MSLDNSNLNAFNSAPKNAQTVDQRLEVSLKHNRPEEILAKPLNSLQIPSFDNPYSFSFNSFNFDSQVIDSRLEALSSQYYFNEILSKPSFPS